MPEIDKLAWLYIKDKRVLVARSIGRDTFYIPGGKRELGESDHQALIREIKEELAVDLIPATIKYIKTFKAQADNNPNGTIVKLTCFSGEFIGNVRASAEIEEITWFNYQDKSRCSTVTGTILEWLKTHAMIE